jgi:hypothetical protein
MYGAFAKMYSMDRKMSETSSKDDEDDEQLDLAIR